MNLSHLEEYLRKLLSRESSTLSVNIRADLHVYNEMIPQHEFGNLSKNLLSYHFLTLVSLTFSLLALVTTLKIVMKNILRSRLKFIC